MNSTRVPLTPVQYMAQMNLEDSRKYSAERDDPDVSKDDQLKALKKSSGFKAWVKKMRGSKSMIYPTTNFDKDGNRIMKGDTESQPVYDNYDVMTDNRRDRAMGHWEESVGHEMSAADRWAYKNRNYAAAADRGKAVGDPYWASRNPTNPFEGGQSDYYDYTDYAPKEVGNPRNLEEKYRAGWGMGQNARTPFSKAPYDFDTLAGYGITHQRMRGEASYADRINAAKAAQADKTATLGPPQRTPQADPHPLAQNTEWAPTPEPKAAPAAPAPQVADVQAPRTVRRPRVNLREQQLAANQRAGIR